MDASDRNNDGAVGQKMGTERLWSPIFIAIVACTLCTFLVGQGLNAGTSVYLERMGGTAGLAGIGALCFSVAAGVARIVSGPLIDARGRQIVILAGAVVMLVGSLGPLVANDGGVFIFWRLLQGAGFSAATTATATAAADVLPLSRMGEGIGYYGLGQAISMSIGPALAIFLVSTDPAQNFYLGVAACSAAALALAFAIRYERHPETLPVTSEYRVMRETGKTEPEAAADALAAETDGLSGWRRALDGVFEPGALPGFIPILFMCAAFSFNIFYMGLYGSSLGVGAPGIFYTVSAVLMIAVRLTSGRFMDRAAPIRIMGIACASGILAFAMLFLCGTGVAHGAAQALFYAAGVPFGICMGLAIPVNQTVAVRNSPSARWGAANALFMLGLDVGNGVLSVIWGFMAEAAGFPAVLATVMICLVAGYGAARLLYPKGSAGGQAI